MFRIKKISSPYVGDVAEILDTDYEQIESAYEALRGFFETEQESGHFEEVSIELDQYEGAGMDVWVKDGDVEVAKFAIEFLT